MDSILGGAEAPVQDAAAVGTPIDNTPVQDAAPVQETAKWYEHDDVPEELRGQLAKFPDPRENPYALATSYAHLEKKLGRNTIAKIDENSTEEQINEFYNGLGRPESPDGYEITRAEGLELSEADQQTATEAMAELHKLGLTQAQAQGVFALNDKLAMAVGEAAQAQIAAESEAQFNSLKAEYGDNFNAFVEKVNMAANTLDPDGTLAEAGLANHPAVLKVLERAAQTYAPKSMVTDPASQNEGGLAAIESQIAAIRNNPAYRTAGHPDQQRLINDMSMLAQKKVALQRA